MGRRQVHSVDLGPGCNVALEFEARSTALQEFVASSYKWFVSPKTVCAVIGLYW